jgi:uncharacterized repeat protein (TIGR03843 family)
MGIADVPSEDLVHAELHVEGQLVAASNATLLCTLAGTSVRCVYKPVQGEQELWDFPAQTLGKREVASYLLATALGWDLIPQTVWREDGPFGPGMCQRWIEGQPDVVVVTGLEDIPDGWRTVLRAHDAQGQRVYLAHADRLDLQRLAVLDAILNNADRKAGHILRDSDDRVWAIDHGVTFAREPKLRTVLWGWTGEAIPPVISEELQRSSSHDVMAVLEPWLTEAEIKEAISRLQTLQRTGTFAAPSADWPAIPWPVF